MPGTEVDASPQGFVTLLTVALPVNPVDRPKRDTGGSVPGIPRFRWRLRNNRTVRLLRHRPAARRPAALLVVLVVGLLSSSCTWASPFGALEAPRPAETSKIFAADGTLVTSLHAEQDREDVPLDKIPQNLRNAVVAIEDERFWAHKGVDFQAVLRAARENASQGHVVQGGSTITQQYVKNALVGRDRDLGRKLKEASLAYQLEQRYTKAHILELYLNSVYFGNGAYGVQAASQEYFATSVDKLDLAQSALLAGLIREPNAGDPMGRRGGARWCSTKWPSSTTSRPSGPPRPRRHP
jgi:membrane peptidoglycan carboxypeptidase